MFYLEEIKATNDINQITIPIPNRGECYLLLEKNNYDKSDNIIACRTGCDVEVLSLSDNNGNNNIYRLIKINLEKCMELTFDSADVIQISCNLPYLQKINGLYTTELEHFSMYDENNISDMDGMFCGCTSLQLVSALNTSKVINMDSMFGDCSDLLLIPKMDTTNVVNMRCMFSGCTSLMHIPKMNTGKVKNMEAMFFDCISLKNIPKLNTENVETMRLMFYGCTSLESVPELNMSKVKDRYRMFYFCDSLKKS